MKFELRSNRNFWAGMLFPVSGAGAMLVARRCPPGSTQHGIRVLPDDSKA